MSIPPPPITPPASMKTYHIQPEEPFELEMPLSILDAMNPAINSRTMLIYKAPENPPANWQEDLAERLMTSFRIFLRKPEDGVMSIPRLLTDIYPDPVNGRLTARITKESSVQFVVRHQPDFTFAQLHPEHDFPTRHGVGEIFSTVHEGLPPLVDGKWDGFAVQLTFIDGGFTILISKHHYLIDGGSTGNLVRWWFARARELMTEKTATGPMVVDPAYSKAVLDDSTLLMEPKVEPKEHMEWKVVPNCRFPTLFGTTLPKPWVMTVVSYLPFLKPKLTGSVWHFSAAKLQQLVSDVKEHTDQQFSTHDAVCALIWRCVTRARFFTTRRTDLLPEHSMMALSVNVRAKLEPKLHNDYFGNAAAFGPSQLPAATLTANGATSLGEIALTIRDAISTKTSNDYLRSLVQLTAAQPRITDVVNSFRAYRGYDMVITSWMAMFKSLEELDVGVGTFQRLRQPGGSNFDGVAVVMPSYGVRGVDRDVPAGEFKGGMEVSLDLLTPAFEVFKNDPELLQYARYTEA